MPPTGPLEWVEWAVNNTHRLDIYYQKDSHSRDQGLLTTPLPNNERNQFRWNGPAFGIGSNSAGIGKGSIGGGQEFDPGCWVAP